MSLPHLKPKTKLPANSPCTVFAFPIGFYALPFGEAAGYNVSFPILAMINGLTLLPLIALYFYGEKVREWQGTPHIHEDL